MVWTNVYNLSGQLNSSVAIAGDSDINLKSYPNPATERVKVEYTLPENISSATLYLLDSSGRAVNDYLVDSHTGHLDLDVSNLESGMYFYFVEYGGKRSETTKVVVQ